MSQTVSEILNRESSLHGGHGVRREGAGESSPTSLPASRSKTEELQLRSVR